MTDLKTLGGAVAAALLLSPFGMPTAAAQEAPVADKPPVAAAESAAAAEPAVDKNAVVVNGIRNPELKTYRVMAAGLDAFDKYHELAPTAPEVRFKLRPRSGKPSADMSGLAMRIAGDTISIPLPVAADHTFSLPRSEAARKENADLLLNKPKGGYRWQPDVHSAGVPEGMRRLGDLRLECKVLVATAKEEIGFWLTSMINTLLLTTDWCSHEKIQLSTAAAQRIATATLTHGDQRVQLKLNKEGTSYTPPLGNKAYPDDALIELRYADEPSA
ncbi:hypothetical protein ASC94_06475 [Massilia sp. Root418]|jgi:hypothetical protein|uniref:hypothetical protein n=1 Tax=Massilia sp. Root418 TaxID=1736532 RepID=UPI00070233DF|nr:hypothetical protein [Massilia sp. Root418]KQW96489.1 hypothetical protein ASC94_06475 [Massilia sp. Root418]